MKNKNPESNRKKSSKKPAIILAIIFVVILLGGVLAYFLFFRTDAPLRPNKNLNVGIEDPDPIYSNLTGLEIADENLNSSPTFCIQIPNGSTDGARPQVGLTQAGVVFEAIAETGITRFAAVFQNPTSSAIGPVRSLRPYYLDWDTPFDCTVTHAGGSDEAIAALRKGGQRNLDENYSYMWREDNTGRLWNNLFTSPTDLLQFNADHGYTTSSPKTFPRLTPEEATEIAKQNLNPPECSEDTDCITADQLNRADTVRISFGNWVNYNTVYNYVPETNIYARSYQSGDTHLVYECPAGLNQPNTKTECGDLKQVAPSAIVAMMVQEHTMADGYHESIATIGSGTAYIFQNGEVNEGTWGKSSQDSQIVFKDAAGEIIKFTPGQLWIAAVPQFGSVSWE